MSKVRADIEIGKRAYEEVMRLYSNESSRAISRRIGCEYKTVNSWRTGYSPSAIYLSRLHEMGADVIWILTGVRK